MISSLHDLQVARGYKTQVSLVLYALLRSGKILNRETNKPMTIADFSRLLKANNIDLNVRNLCHRAILHPTSDDAQQTTQFLQEIINTIQESSNR